MTATTVATVMAQVKIEAIAYRLRHGLAPDHPLVALVPEWVREAEMSALPPPNVDLWWVEGDPPTEPQSVDVLVMAVDSWVAHPDSGSLDLGLGL